MPRLPYSLLHTAVVKDPLLPKLLKECRTLEQATAELRWLREHVQLENGEKGGQKYLKELCERRSRGEPLQYILGTQPFGGLEILCRKGVLIPRPETEHLTSHLFSHISSNIQQPVKYPLRILDLCSGSGCIPLHLYSLLSHADIPSRCLGIDISHAAITLAQDNIKRNIDLGVLPKSASEDVQFRQGNILLPGFNLGKIQRVFNGQGWGSLKGASEGRRADIVVSNPPYISSRGFNTETARSVRNYEPKLALVPPREGYQVTDGDEDEDGDIFYPVVSSIAKELSAKILLVEVGGWEQAERVKAVWQDGGGWGGVAVWMDYSGKGRGVVAWKKGWEWVEEGPVVG